MWCVQLDAFRRVCRADEGPLAGAEARALHSTLDVAARQAAMHKTLTVRGTMRAQVYPYPSILPCPGLRLRASFVSRKFLSRPLV